MNSSVREPTVTAHDTVRPKAVFGFPRDLDALLACLFAEAGDPSLDGFGDLDVGDVGLGGFAKRDRDSDLLAIDRHGGWGGRRPLIG